jgi:hypothetical protein
LHKEEKDFQRKMEDASVDNQGSEFGYETPLGNFESFESKFRKSKACSAAEFSEAKTTQSQSGRCGE